MMDMDCYDSTYCDDGDCETCDLWAVLLMFACRHMWE